MMLCGVGQYDPNYEMLESYYVSGSGAGEAGGTGDGIPLQIPYDVGAVYTVTGTARAPRDIPWWILVLLGVAVVMIIANN